MLPLAARHRLTWQKMMRIVERWLPSPKLRHVSHHSVRLGDCPEAQRASY
jgi:hypothetical protein